MPINEALFAAMKAASYIKPNAGKSYKLQRVAEELIAKQAPDNPKCRVEDAFAPMADGYAVPLRVFTPLVAYGAPLPEALEESSANGTPRGLGNIRDSARRITQSPTQNTHQGKHVERQRRRYFRQCQHGTSLSHAAWHDPVFPRWRLDHRAASTCTRRLARIWPYVCNAV